MNPCPSSFSPMSPQVGCGAVINIRYVLMFIIFQAASPSCAPQTFSLVLADAFLRMMWNSDASVLQFVEEAPTEVHYFFTSYGREFKRLLDLVLP